MNDPTRGSDAGRLKWIGAPPATAGSRVWKGRLIAIAAFAALVGCNKLPASLPIPPQGDSPPQAFLDSRLLSPFSELAPPVIELTPGQIARSFGDKGSWSKLVSGAYVLTVTSEDELTHRPMKMMLEFAPVPADEAPIFTDDPAVASPACHDCVPAETLVKITRGILNDQEMDAGDISRMETDTFKMHLPLPPSLLAARQAYRVPPPCDAPAVTSQFPKPSAILPPGASIDRDVHGTPPNPGENPTRVYSFTNFADDGVDPASSMRTCHATANFDVGPRVVTYRYSRWGGAVRLESLTLANQQPPGEAVLHPTLSYVQTPYGQAKVLAAPETPSGTANGDANASPPANPGS